MPKPFRPLRKPAPSWPSSPDVLWAEFEKRCLPPGSPRHQRVEMRKAFISGLFSMVGEMQRMPDLDDESLVGALDAYWNDLKRRMNAMSPETP